VTIDDEISCTFTLVNSINKLLVHCRFIPVNSNSSCYQSILAKYFTYYTKWSVAYQLQLIYLQCGFPLHRVIHVACIKYIGNTMVSHMLPNDNNSYHTVKS